MLRNAAVALVSLMVCLGIDARPAAAAETWYEIKSPHFTVWSEANDGDTRTLVWQLEQIRSAIAAVWPWARLELPKPLLVIAARNDGSMRRLVPGFWEQGSVRPASVWVTGPDQHYLVIRTDLRGEDKSTIHPHIHAYFSYVSIILQATFPRALPEWLHRGLAGVMSNTIVRADYILIGPPIPWHLQRVRQEARLPIQAVLKVTANSPELRQDLALERFDAQSWAFVHMLMFGEEGAYLSRLNRFVDMLRSGKPSDVAFGETLGKPDDYTRAFRNYVARNVFSYQKAAVDASVKRETFVARVLSPADAAGGRAVFQRAMRRPNEMRALIEEARRADPGSAAALLAEAMEAEDLSEPDRARAAFEKAVESGTSSAYAHYRFAALSWRSAAASGPDNPMLQRIEHSLVRATELAPSYAAAYALLAETRAALGAPASAVTAVLGRAISLEPSNAWHRLAAARVMWRFGDVQQARAQARAALENAVDEPARAEAQKLLMARSDKEQPRL